MNNNTDMQEMMDSVVSYEWFENQLTIQAQSDGTLEPSEYFIIRDLDVKDGVIFTQLEIHKKVLN